MIDRYSRQKMKAVWSEENKYRKWLDVELAVCQAWSELGRIPQAALKTIEEKAAFDMARIEEVERTVKHDVIAFLTCLAEHVGEDSRYIHLGLTSYDVVDTALSLLIKESLALVRRQAAGLRDIIREQAVRHKRTVMVGRTHGVHAEPITFGVKLLVWYEEMKRHLTRLEAASETISVGRISGSVGTYIHLDPRVEEIALAKLGLQPAPVSTQVLQRDRHAEVLAALALLASSLDKFAVDCGISSGPRCWKWKSPSPRARRVHPPCPTRKIRCGPNASPAWPGSSVPTSWPAWRISGYGMSGTSPILRPSGLSSPTPSS